MYERKAALCSIIRLPQQLLYGARIQGSDWLISTAYHFKTTNEPLKSQSVSFYGLKGSVC